MANLTFVPSRTGFVELMQSPEMGAIIDQYTQRAGEAARSLGKGTYEADTRVGRTRQRGMIKTKDWDAIVSNSAHNVLVKALRSGGGGG